jgi:hypothetical protein
MARCFTLNLLNAYVEVDNLRPGRALRSKAEYHRLEGSGSVL